MTCLEKMRKQVERYYFRRELKYLDLDNPRTYNEKIQWSKLYDSTPIKTKLADKYLVREWVKKKIGEQYLIPLLGVYDCFDQIDFGKLPEKFVLKCNHGCKYMLFVNSQHPLDIQTFKHESLDMKKAKAYMDNWMKTGYENMVSCELQYCNIPRKIIAETFIDNNGYDIPDYKFMCFNGKVEVVFVVSGKMAGDRITHFSLYDKNWNKACGGVCRDDKEGIVPKPDKLDEMINIAEKLSSGFPHVRVDLYQLDTGQIYFGEMTFTSASGFFHHWNDDSFDRYFGDKFQLPEKGYDIETGKYFDIPRGNPITRTIKKIIFNTLGMILKPVRIMKRAIFGKKKQKITSI